MAAFFGVLRQPPSVPSTAVKQERCSQTAATPLGGGRCTRWRRGGGAAHPPRRAAAAGAVAVLPDPQHASLAAIETMRALNAGARVPIDEPSGPSTAAPVAAAPSPPSSASPPAAAHDTAAADDLDQRLRTMLRSHAAAAAGPGTPATLHAAEEDIILRELEMTELLLANTAPDAAPSGGRTGLLRRALTVTTLAAAGSPFRTFQMLKRHPGLLRTDPRELADRVLTLKLLLPACDVSDLIYQKPSLLLMEDLAEQVVAASKQMQALMPGTQWQAKLGSGGTAFMSFCSILGSGGGGGLKGNSGSSSSSSKSRGQASGSRSERGSGGGGGAG